MIYDSSNYLCLKENKQKEDVKVPAWLGKFLDDFAKPKAKKDNVRIAHLFNTEVSEHNCSCCGRILNEDEVTFCKRCIQNSIN